MSIAGSVAPGVPDAAPKAPARARAARLGRPAPLCLPLAAVLVVLFVWPLATLVHESLWDAQGSVPTFSHYVAIATTPRLRMALLTSLGLSAAIAVASTVVCLGPAWLLARGTLPGARVLRAILALPMAFSGVIVGFLMVVTLGRSGFVPELADRLLGARWLAGSAYTWLGLVAAYLYFEIPRATLALESAVRRVDLRVIDAARSLGAGRMALLWWVLLPMLRDALVSTTCLTFSVSLGSFGVILVLATRQVSVLPLEIFMAYLAFPSDRAKAAAMSVTLLCVALAATAVTRVWLGHRAAPSASGARRAPSRRADPRASSAGGAWAVRT